MFHRLDDAHGMVTFPIPATIIGYIGIAVVFHEGSTLVVVANALRLLGYRSRSSGVVTPTTKVSTS